MSVGKIYVWKEAPFLRLLIPVILGITIQWYVHASIWIVATAAIGGLLFQIVFRLSNPWQRFRWYWIHGISVNLFYFMLGSLITAFQDDTQLPASLIKYYKKDDVLIAVLQEPLSEKKGSFKAVASIAEIARDSLSIRNIHSSIILYFEKDSVRPALQYGSKVSFKKTLQPIKNSGNPNSFDYRRYCLFQHISFQVYLKKNEYKILNGKERNFFNGIIFTAREKIIGILHRFIKGKKEAGLAEALLIGYRDDLDKTLIQSYSNTGVVHIIAISGLHLALIYLLLQALFKHLPRGHALRWFQPLCVIAGLWIFSILSGASPSVMRSAVMFSCIVVGDTFSKKTSIYNSLSASAFLLLCFNPFWLWDAGFQLSYGAVLSIVIFRKPIYNAFYIQNKLLDGLWQSASVSLGAQILTTPISIYLFHQFPVYFLFTNLAAVPLSSLVLLGEIALCIIGFFSWAANYLGLLINWLVWLMNSIVEYFESLPFSVWRNMEINELQVIGLYLFIGCITAWLFQKNKSWLWPALLSLAFFFIERTHSFIRANQRQEMIVYNIPKHRAIDFMEGRKSCFVSDTILQEDPTLQNFYLGLARIYFRTIVADTISSLTVNYPIFFWGKKRFVLIGKSFTRPAEQQILLFDALILSDNTRISIRELSKYYKGKVWIFDGSNSERRVAEWKKECEQLGFNYHDVVDKGAFVMRQD